MVNARMKMTVSKLSILLLCFLEYSIEGKSDLYTSLCSQNGAVINILSDESLGNQCDAQNFTVTCSSLQAAIIFVSETDDSRDNLTICMEESSTQFLTKSMFFDKVSIQIVSKDSVMVECAYDSNLEADVRNGTDYTWYFNSSSVLLLSNVHLTHCPYPLRVVGVKKVLIQNSSFK